MTSLQTNETQSVLEHFGELRNKIFIALGVFFVGTIITHIFHNQIIRIIFLPLHGRQLIFTSIIDPILFIFKIDFIVGFLIALPVTSWLILKFISPAFKEETRSKILSFLSISIGLTISAICYTYFIIAPMCIKFLFEINIVNVQSLITAQSYISFLLSLIAISTIVFQIPLIIAIGTLWGVINPYKLVKKRGWVYMGIVLSIGMFVPPDMFSHLITVIPTMAIFEISTLISKIIYNKKQKISLF